MLLEVMEKNQLYQENLLGGNFLVLRLGFPHWCEEVESAHTVEDKTAQF